MKKKTPKPAPKPLWKTRYFLGQDSSCHWYLVDASRRADWEEWENLSEDDEKSWTPPSFATAIDSPHEVEFYLAD